MSTIKPIHTNLVYVLALVFAILGIFGLLDIRNQSTYGYSTDGDFTITKIDKGGAAEAAGLMVNDQIDSINGLSVRDSKAWVDVLRPAVGETREYIVDRKGESVSASLTYAAQEGSDRILNYLGWILGLIFLGMALWAFRNNKTMAAFYFALFAIAFGASFMGGPYIENGTLRDLNNVLRFSFILIGFACLVSFLLRYPNRSSFLDKKNADMLVFAPSILLALFFIALNFLLPDSTSGLNTFINYMVMLFVVYYFGWALLTLVRGYFKASVDERSNTGLGMMFWGAIIGLVPILISIVVATFMPTVSLPGSDYYFLLFALIPILFALALNKSVHE